MVALESLNIKSLCVGNHKAQTSDLLQFIFSEKSLKVLMRMISTELHTIELQGLVLSFPVCDIISHQMLSNKEQMFYMSLICVTGSNKS